MPFATQPRKSFIENYMVGIKLFKGRDSALFSYLVPIHCIQQLKLGKYLLINTKLDLYKTTKFGGKSFS